jgi:DNA-binding beta-propeller fold protein YncE
LRSLSVAAATTSFLPGILAERKSDCGAPIVGCGVHRYEVLHDWAKLPVKCVLGNTHGVTEDAQGRIVVKQTVGKGSICEDAVLVFDADGEFIESWGSEFKGGAHGLHRAFEGDEEFFYLCDTNRRLVIKTRPNGEELWRVDAGACGDIYNNPDGFCPTNVATAPDGTVFVADGYGSSFIHKFDPDAKYRGTFGGAGAGPGQLNCPHGLIVDTRGDKPRLIVADRGNRRLQIFDMEGRHTGFVRQELRAPCHFDELNGVLLVPDLESRVTLLDREDRLIAHLGDGGHYKGLRDKPREAFKAGQFVAPHSACFDRFGNIFVVEWVEVGRITKLKKLS